MRGCRLDEIRLVELIDITSASDAWSLSTISRPVPAGKIWTVFVAQYFPSVEETKLIRVGKITQSGLLMTFRGPITIQLNDGWAYPFVEGGDPFVLFPREALFVARFNPTVGSTMRLQAQFVESDLPLMKYVEPQRVLSRRRRQAAYGPLSNLDVARSDAGSHEGQFGGGGDSDGGPGGGGDPLVP